MGLENLGGPTCCLSKEKSLKLIWRALGDNKRGNHVKGHVHVTFIENTIWGDEECEGQLCCKEVKGRGRSRAPGGRLLACTLIQQKYLLRQLQGL